MEQQDHIAFLISGNLGSLTHALRGLISSLVRLPSADKTIERKDTEVERDSDL